MKKIKLTQDKFAIVDDVNFEYLNQWKWHYRSTGYAARTLFNGGKTKKIYMHKIIIDVPTGKQIDHINGNRLDNRRENLRAVTPQQNSFNRKVQSNNSSGVVGVRWEEDRGKWLARIKLSGITKNLGRFINKEDAIFVRKEAEREMFKEYRRVVN